MSVAAAGLREIQALCFCLCFSVAVSEDVFGIERFNTINVKAFDPSDAVRAFSVRVRDDDERSAQQVRFSDASDRFFRRQSRRDAAGRIENEKMSFGRADLDARNNGQISEFLFFFRQFESGPAAFRIIVVADGDPVEPLPPGRSQDLFDR